MLLRKAKKAPVTIRRARQVQTGAWTDTRDTFVALEPLDLQKFKGSVMTASKAHRPYLSKIAKMEGAEYFTIGIDDQSMLVVRIKPLVSKKGTHHE